jgi:hypothetical protein
LEFLTIFVNKFETLEKLKQNILFKVSQDLQKLNFLIAKSIRKSLELTSDSIMLLSSSFIILLFIMFADMINMNI